MKIEQIAQTAFSTTGGGYCSLLIVNLTKPRGQENMR